MASIDRTAYPRFRAQLTDAELEADYTLSEDEETFVRRNARGGVGRLSMAVSLKTRQRLGYFPALTDVPDQVRLHISTGLGLEDRVELLDGVTQATTLHRYREAIRKHLGSRPFSHGGREVVIKTVHRAAQVMSDPADLISASVEALIKDRIELPAFSTLDRQIGTLRQAIHDELYARVDGALSEVQRQILDAMLEHRTGEHLNAFSRLKETPGPPSLKHLRLWIDRLAELDAVLDPRPLLGDIPHTKIRQFAAEAKALETGDLRDVCQPGRRHTLLLCLLHQTQTETRDQLVEMFIRRMRRTRNRAVDRLHKMQKNQRAIEEALLGVFGQVLHHAGATDADEDLGRNVRHLLAEQGGLETLGAQFHAVTAYHNDNYLPLLWPIHSNHRSALFQLLDLLTLGSSSADMRLLETLDVVRQHQRSRRQVLNISLDLRFASQRWQAFVQKKQDGEILLDRHALELCVFMYLAEALQSGDLYVVGSGAYDDYRAQLLPWNECDRRLDDYGAAVKLPTDATGFVAELREKLGKLAKKVDAGFPDNSALRIDPDGSPHLVRQAAQALPQGLYAFEEAIRVRMPERHLLDVLKHTEHWCSFTRHFGPLSGSDAKLDDATKRYLFTVFGIGCNLGVNQTARHAPESINRHSLRRINAQHVNVEKLDAASGDIVCEYVRFDLTRLWGKPNVAIADGTHMELRENNLLGEQHIRYGRYGGIAYHHISATYIALFSNFIACGVWEAVYILDGLLQNRSDFEVDTVHADTHGQSEPVFGLAYLLGIELLPRMRTWNDAVFYRPDAASKYKHIDALFTKSIDWRIIEAHWQDMMQVVLSIQAGKVLPSMLLRKLGSRNRQNRLYRAFRELGRVVRTLFLLRFVSEADLRQSIRAETTKIESYNDFLDWIGFGGPVIKSGDPVEQVKQVKYMDLVANAVMLHNVADLTDVLAAMAEEGLPVTRELASKLSPYTRDHLRRFGHYTLDMDDLPPALDPRPLPISVDDP
jgi:TnpA family transposase